MLQPGYSSLEEKPKAVFLRRMGGLLLVAGLALNISLMLMGRVDLSMRLALLIMAPGLIMLFTAFLAENTPSMQGCLTMFALALAFVAGFWAWVGVSVALAPADRPSEMLRGAPANEAEDVGEPEPEEPPDDGEDESGDEQ